MPCGTPIYAASSGLVTYTGNGHSRNGLTGHVIVVDHGDGVETTYNHMYANGVGVRPGQQVQAGQIIGAVGSDGNSTGCHLHYGVYLDGQHTNPVPFLAIQGTRLG
ncbi:M23 family metallopeptidase [Georgenia deserti]|uniref:M23 family metallopeptidase n=1 Tax=Georgenia deserti TaxID=2093781 RepID=UPI0036D8A6FA